MTDLSRVMSPVSWLLSALSVLGTCIALLQPSPVELLVVLLADSVALGLMHAASSPLFLRLYPDSRLFFPVVQTDKIKKLGHAEVVQLLNALVRFPQRRALFVWAFTFVKIIPAILLVVYYWEHTISNLAQFLIILTFEFIIQCYLYGVIFLEHHTLISQVMARLHEECGWDRQWAEVQYPGVTAFTFQDRIAMASIGLFVITLQFLTIVMIPSEPGALALKVLAVGLVGFMLLVRLWMLERSYFVGGLEKLFKAFESYDYTTRTHTIPLHSTKLLARFEMTFNYLSERLKQNERELSQWLIHEMEQARYRALGEISGLVAHDLMGPLQTINFCSGELLEAQAGPAAQAAQAGRQRYLEQLKDSADRAIRLVQSIYAYLRPPAASNVATVFDTAQSYVLQVLRTEFRDQGISKVRFEIDPSVQPLRLSLPESDLVHVLYNLYKNSLRNLLGNGCASPAIRVWLESAAAETCDLRIADNGTGLSPKRFEAMTAFRFSTPNHCSFREGLGLRLTRRMIERDGGALAVVTTSGPGTTFSLTLRLAPPPQPQSGETPLTPPVGEPAC